MLTPQMIYEFVDKILVHAPDKSSGERVQEVEIYLKFIGKFHVPQPEPTVEELEKPRKGQAAQSLQPGEVPSLCPEEKTGTGGCGSRATI